jgi:hypothetical protein
MVFANNYDPPMVAQFYATVHFSTTEERNFTWMTGNEVCRATLAEFGAILGYPVYHPTDRTAFCCHNLGRPMHKDALAPLYMQGNVVPGLIKFLLPTWDILNRVIRDTVAPKVGNLDQIHGFQVDLLVNTYNNRGKGLKLDIMDFIWNEMTLICTSKRVPAFCPYVMALIMNKSRLAQEVVPTLRLIQHKSRTLLIKDHPAPPGAPHVPSEEDYDTGLFGDDGPSSRPARSSRRGSRRGKEVDDSEAPPSWAKKLFASVGKVQSSLNKLFCYADDIHARQYQAYEAARQDRSYLRTYMHSQGHDVSHIPEESAIPREQWLSPHYGYFTDPSAAPPSPQHQSQQQPPRQSHRRSRRQPSSSSRPSYAEDDDEE